jgi:hypothetical protein
MSKRLARLGRFSWTLHNLVAHPVSEILFLIGLEKASNFVHDITVPEHQEGQGRG